jgi:hypothetical protein
MKSNLILTLIGVIFIGLFCFFAYMHEQAHVQIYKHYNINSHIEYIKSFPNLATYPESNCPENSTCKLENSINEAIGYQLMPIFVFLIVSMFILIALIIYYINLKEEKDE